MKNLACGLLILFIALTHVFGQSQVKTKIYIAEITTKNHEIAEGILYSVNDSSAALYTENTAVKKRVLSEKSVPLKIYSYRDIQMIKVLKRGAIAEGALIGGGSGLMVGALIDALMGAAYPWGTLDGSGQASFTPIFTITFGVIGSAIGAGVGSSTKKFEFTGTSANLGALESELMLYSFK